MPPDDCCVILEHNIVSPAPLTVVSAPTPAVLTVTAALGAVTVRTEVHPPAPAAVTVTSGSPRPVSIESTPGTLIVGVGGATDEYVHHQTVAAPVWTINHNLGRHVAVELTDLGGTEVDADVTNPTLNQTVVTYLVPRTGYAIIH